MPPKLIYRIDCIEGIITILLEGFPDYRYSLYLYEDSLLIYVGDLLNNGFASTHGNFNLTAQYITLKVVNQLGEVVHSETFINPCTTVSYDCEKGLFTRDATEVYVDGQLVSGTVYLEDGSYNIEVRKGAEVFRETITVYCCNYWKIEPTVTILKRECKEWDVEEVTAQLCGFTIGQSYIISDMYGTLYSKVFNEKCAIFTFTIHRGDILYITVLNDKYFTLPYFKNTGANKLGNCGSVNVATNYCGDDCVINYSHNCFCVDYNSPPPYNGVGSIAIQVKYPGEYKFRITPDPLTNFGSAVYPLDGSYYIAESNLPYYSLPVIVDGLYIVEVINKSGAVCKTLEFDVKCGALQYDCELGLQSPPAEIYLLQAGKSFITPTINNKNLFFPQLVQDTAIPCGGYQLEIQQKIGDNAIYRNICNACCCIFLGAHSVDCNEIEDNKAKVFLQLGYNPLYQKGLFPKVLELGGIPNGPLIFNVDANTPEHYVWVEGLNEGTYEIYLRDLTYNSIKYEDVTSTREGQTFLTDCVVTRKFVVNCSPCECEDTSMGIVPAELIECYKNFNGTLTFVIKFNFNICPIAVGKTYVTNIQYNVGGKFRGVLEFTEDSLQAQIDKGNAIIHFPLEIGCDDANAVLTIDSITISVDRDYCTYGPFTVTGGLCEVCSNVCSCCDISKVSADKRLEYSCSEGAKPGYRRIRLYNEESYDVLFDVVKLPNCNVACCNSINDSNACSKVKEGNIVWSDQVAAKSMHCIDLQDDRSDSTACYVVKFQKKTDPNCTKCVVAKLVFD